MSAIAELPLHVILAALLWLMAAGTIWQGVRRLAKGLSGVDHPASAVRVVRGIRGVIVAVSLEALGGGMLFASKGLLVFHEGCPLSVTHIAGANIHAPVPLGHEWAGFQRRRGLPRR